MRVLGVDPGLRACGLALLDGDAWKTQTIRTPVTDLASRLSYIAKCIKAFAGGPVDVLVVEMMNVHDGRATNKQDLIPLAMVGGAAMAVVPSARICLPKATTWKGGVPKKIHHNRLKQQLPALAGKRVSKDAWDAVGLVLYGKKKHAFSNP